VCLWKKSLDAESQLLFRLQYEAGILDPGRCRATALQG